MIEIDEELETAVREMVFETLLQEIVTLGHAGEKKQVGKCLLVAERIVIDGDRRLPFELFNEMQRNVLKEVRAGNYPAEPDELAGLLDTIQQVDDVLARWPETPVV